MDFETNQDNQSGTSSYDDIPEMNEKIKERISGWIQLAIVVGVLLFAISVNLLLHLGNTGPRILATGEENVTVQVVRPEILPHEISVNETGTVGVRAPVNLVPEVGGRVLSVSDNLAPGGFFQADEILFTIDPTNFQLALAQAEADLKSAESNLALETAEAELSIREWNLLNPGEDIPSLVAREPQLEGAKSAVLSAQARVADAETDLSRAKYSLPFAGRVVESDIEVGQTLAPNQNYGSAYRLETVEVSVAISDMSLQVLNPVVGREAVIRGRNSSYVELGQVIRQEAQLDTRTRMARIAVGFESPTEFLPGSFVDVTLRGAQVEETLSIPVAAIQPDDTVWIVEDGKLAKRTPEILVRYPDSLVANFFDYGEGIIFTPILDASIGLPAVISAEYTQ